MGMSTGGHKGGVSSEINVTPLIDVLLVLLIIFLVVMPIMMKMEKLTIPRKLDQENEQLPDKITLINVKVKVDTFIIWNEGNEDQIIQAAELHSRLSDKLPNMKSADRVVFVDFEDGVPWTAVVATMDEIRHFSTDTNHDEVKVALKIREADKAQQQ